jgi:hypothetical protein
MPRVVLIVRRICYRSLRRRGSIVTNLVGTAGRLERYEDGNSSKVHLAGGHARGGLGRLFCRGYRQRSEQLLSSQADSNSFKRKIK